MLNRRCFQKASPIWLKDKVSEMNFRAIFQTKIQLNENTKIHLATSCVYNLYVDGQFVAYGPARAGRNIFRMDEIPLGRYATETESFVTIEVQSYQVNSFYIMQQDPFLQAELCTGSEVLSYTGDKIFRVCSDKTLVRKVQRFSFQRPFIEAYRLKSDSYDYRVNGLTEVEDYVACEQRQIIMRETPYPEYEELNAKMVFGGTSYLATNPQYGDSRSYTGIGETLKGFRAEDLEWHIAREVQDYEFKPNAQASADVIATEEYKIYELPYNAAGFPMCNITVKEDTVLYVLFGEVLRNDDVTVRGECCSAVKYELKAGIYDLKFFEVYGMKYIKLFVKSGLCSVKSVKLITYMHPQVTFALDRLDSEGHCLMEAAAHTFCANAVDLFTDCPSRERGGYPCDSFFMGRAEYFFTGENHVERSFLQNFLHEDDYQCIDKGMIPMCYPADHLDGVYIPNWSLWLILELGEYLERTGDRELIDDYQDKVVGIIDFHRKLEIKENLLAYIPEGVFVEWSHANEMVQDINYPSNMLYYAALRVASRLYGEPSYALHAEKIKKAIIEYAYNGQFFCDHAKIEAGTIRTVNESSEACQYYAFCFGIADTLTFPALYQTLVDDFTPERRQSNKYPDICFAELFIGIPLRIEMLLRHEMFDKAYEEIVAYYLSHAKQTGTLWEVHAPSSCNHGYSSVVAYWLDEIRNKMVKQVLQ